MPAEGVGGADDGREAELAGCECALGFGHAVNHERPRGSQSGVSDGLAKDLTVLCAADRVEVCADQLNPEALERSGLSQLAGEV